MLRANATACSFRMCCSNTSSVSSPESLARSRGLCDEDAPDCAWTSRSFREMFGAVW
jgi:hypothetical protein